MSRFLRRSGKAFLFLAATLTILAGSVLLVALVGWLMRFSDSVTLPNGMILKREFDLSKTERDDLFASDGRTALARDVEFVCFNDRYVKIYSYDRKYSGIYDGATDRPVPINASKEVHAASGLIGGHGCNGYYTGMVGPSLLYDGMVSPFLPPCSWRSLNNPTLTERSWFARPCDEDTWARGSNNEMNAR